LNKRKGSNGNWRYRFTDHCIHAAGVHYDCCDIRLRNLEESKAIETPLSPLQCADFTKRRIVPNLRRAYVEPVSMPFQPRFRFAGETHAASPLRAGGTRTVELIRVKTQLIIEAR
jgi:hypothetical protein